MFYMAVDVRSGEVAWQERGLSRALSVYADGKMLLLEEDGDLSLASVSPQGLEIHSQWPALTNKAWTAPTLVGTRLFLRDRVQVAAVELE
jgi:hypothetical protein